MKKRDDASLPAQVVAYVRDPAVALWRKMTGAVAAAYLISPIDFVPDVIPLLGWLDDIGVVSAAAWFLVRDIRKHARRRRELPDTPR